MVRELDPVIESMREDDWEQVRGIYQQGIAIGNVTFETQAPTWESWDCSHHRAGRLVARSGGEILGWAALSPVSGRCVYAGVAEVSVYVAARYHGMGLGKALLRSLIEASEENGIWTLQAGVFPENQASLILHEKMGFRVVGRHERIGRLNGIWRDVVLLERRSPIVGVE